MSTRLIKQCITLIFGTITVLFSSLAMAFTANTTALNGELTGLWNDVNQPGWGSAITQQYGMIFATVYTYDNAGTPIWYVASGCAVSGSGCTGELYLVSGGTNLTSAWGNPTIKEKSVGTITYTFSDANTGVMSYSINGSNGTKAIAKSIFASPPTASGTLAALAGNYSGSYSGVDAGTFIVSITPVGNMSGTAHSSLYNLNLAIAGTATASGAFSLSSGGSAGDAVFSGTIASSGAVSGTWTFVGSAGGGTFSGTKQ